MKRWGETVILVLSATLTNVESLVSGSSVVRAVTSGIIICLSIQLRGERFIWYASGKSTTGLPVPDASLVAHCMYLPHPLSFRP